MKLILKRRLRLNGETLESSPDPVEVPQDVAVEWLKREWAVKEADYIPPADPEEQKVLEDMNKKDLYQMAKDLGAELDPANKYKGDEGKQALIEIIENLQAAAEGGDNENPEGEGSDQGGENSDGKGADKETDKGAGENSGEGPETDGN